MSAREFVELMTGVMQEIEDDITSAMGSESETKENESTGASSSSSRKKNSLPSKQASEGNKKPDTTGSAPPDEEINTLMKMAGAAMLGLEMAGPFLSAPLRTMHDLQENPVRLKSVSARHENMTKDLEKFTAEMREHEKKLPFDMLERVKHNVDLLADLLQDTGKTIKSIAEDVSVTDENEVFVMEMISSRTAEKISKVEDEIERANNLLNDIHALVDASTTRTRSLAAHAAMIAARTRLSSSEKGSVDVFISHAGEDKPTIAEPLRDELQRRGVRVFLDKDMLPGDDAPDTMKDALATCRVGVFVLSPEFAAKKWPVLEALTLQARERDAVRDDRRGPAMIPVFYRLSVEDCADHALMWRDFDSTGTEKGSAENVFVKFGLSKRVTTGESCIAEVMQCLGKLAKRTGVQNKTPEATNAGTGEMADRRTVLVRNIAMEVERALKRY